jgi:hypothetical protein
VNAATRSSRWLAAGATALLTLATLLQVQAAAAADPWAKVPALTITCYQADGRDQARDPFYARLDAAKDAVAKDKERQDAVNAQIEGRFRSLDPAQQVARMQQWLMANPQEAMKYMQGIQAAANSSAAGVIDERKEQQARDAALLALTRKYDDARRQAYAPVEARVKALRGAAYRPAAVVSDPGFDDPGDSAAVIAEKHAIRRVMDSAYQALCPQWWGPNGQFQTFLRNERNRMRQQRVPYLESFDATRTQQYMIMNTPAASFQSTATHKVAIEYLDLLRKVVNLRESSPRCSRTEYC